MELIKKQIHMENEKASATMQTSIEEDINLAETKPDIEKILFSKGQIRLEEIKVGTGHVNLQGKLRYELLYRTEDGGSRLQSLEGNIPFHEDVHMQDVENGDHVTANGELEDLSVSMINSRKLNLRALITFHLLSDNRKEEDICVDLQEAEEIEYRKKTKEFLELLLHKKDVFRIREEIEVSKTMPDIEEILWKDVQLKDFHVKAQDKKLLLQGDILLSFIYQSAQKAEEQEIAYSWFEKEIPLNGTLDCQESEDHVLPDVDVNLSLDEIEIRNDIDQEARMVGIEATLGMDIRLYQKQSMDMVSDLYGVSEEVVCCNEQTALRRLVLQEDINIKMNEILKTNEGEGNILQISHKEASIYPDEIQIEMGEVSGEMILSGVLQVRVLYEIMKDGEETPKANYAAAIGNFKYQTKVTIPEDTACDVQSLQVHALTMLQELSVTIEDHQTFAINAVIGVKILGYCMKEEQMILDMKLYPIDQDKLSKIPGMAIYYVQDGDTLWQIGKRYYVTTDRIKKINGLTTDLIQPGDKLIIVK